MAVKLVMVRHGQSTWNAANRFTGWTDVELSDRGVDEARRAGRSLRDAEIEFSHCFTSFQRRAIETLWMILQESDQCWLPVDKDWRINERHYGALQGLDKQQTVEKHGIEQVQRWRRGYAIKPPPLEGGDERHPSHDRRYRGIEGLPSSESLADTLERVLPWWRERLLPVLAAGGTPLIAAHGNSMRALVKHLDGVSDEEITGLNIPTGIPLVYEFDAALQPTKHYYLADDDVVSAAVGEVAAQIK